MIDAAVKGGPRPGSARWSRRLKHGLGGAVVAALLATVGQAAECPVPREPRIPASEAPVVNIDLVKKQLRAYQAGNYMDDLAMVMADARTYVERRAGEVTSPAVVLDIDETSLSNWTNLKENDFGFIKSGPCILEPNMSCGFDAWIALAEATAIEPTRNFFDAVRAKNIPVFFITGRRDSQRDATLLNLDHAGYQGYARLVTRPDNDSNPSIVPFKSGERAKLEAAGYTIIATIGDQQSDLAGDHAECGFKLPNPFYFIP
jgi:hypothetical protein